MKKKINFMFRDFNEVVFCRKLYERYGEDYGYSENIDFGKMTMNELRGFVTIFNQLDYENSPARQTYKVLSNGKEFVYDYNKKKRIQDKLNKEFDKRYNNGIASLYKFVDKEIIKNEKWLGERRYTVWSYHLSENESEFQSFLLAYRLYQKSKKLGIDVSGMIEICQMMHSSFSSYLTYSKTNKEDVRKRIMFAHQMIENPDESYEEIVEFKF